MLEGLAGAIEKIRGLAVSAEEPKMLQIDDDKYIDRDLKKIKPEQCECMGLNTLKSTVDYIQEVLKEQKFITPLMVNVGCNAVNVFSGLDVYLDRNHLCRTKPMLPEIEFNRYLDMESFVIQLQTCFEETVNKKNLLELVSKITDEAKVELVDNGITQVVTQTSGTAIKSNKTLSVNPIAKLVAYRTFREVEQPEILYLLRVKDGGRIALFENDGQAWKLEAQRNASDYLREALAEEIVAGTVVVVG